jgi:hypothetical protein
MKAAGILFLLLCALPSALCAQSDLCWREAYPLIPGQWVAYGYMVEAGNRFQVIAGAAVEEWALPYGYEEALRRASRSQPQEGRLIGKGVSDSQGEFKFDSVEPGQPKPAPGYEIRAHMDGREPTAAFVDPSAKAQWVGRGGRIALSQQGKGCSRIYPAGLQEIDCGRLDCDNLPAGKLRIVRADGSPVRARRVGFHRSSMGRTPLARAVISNKRGFISTAGLKGCYQVNIQKETAVTICFGYRPVSAEVAAEATLMLPPRGSKVAKMFQ